MYALINTIMHDYELQTITKSYRKCLTNILTSSQIFLSEIINVVFTLFVFPKSEVLLKKFNNALSITEVVLFKLINFVKSFLKSLVSEFTSSLVILHDLVVEN